MSFDNRCSEHGSIGSLPCAWPNCPNGVDVEEFEEDLIIAGTEPRQWKRRKWNSPLGGSYYSWQSGNLGNWLGAPQTFWNEARRLKLVPASHPDTVYQYTSLEALIGIVESRSLWLTEFEYLNDRREGRYGFDVLLDTVEKMQAEVVRADVRELLAAWEAKLQGKSNRVCIASFSGDADSLSQWRAYGPIAIGFPVRPLSLHVNESRLQPVVYDPELQSKLSQIYVHHLVAAFEADADAGMFDNIQDVCQNSGRLMELGVFFKDSAFASENEYRLAYIDYPDVLNSLGMSSPPRSFRTNGEKIIPYVPSTEILPSEHRDFPLKISNVVLGPEVDELLEHGVRALLNENGLGDVAVDRSRVPLRS